MAQQLANRSGQGITPSRYTEQRAPQFVGGSTDPDTGNVIASSRSLAAQGEAGSPDAASTPAPAQPTTRLADITYQPSGYNYPQPQQPSTLSQALGAVGGLASAIGKQGLSFGGGEKSSNSKDSAPTFGSSSGGGGTTGGAGPLSEGPATGGTSNLNVTDGSGGSYGSASTFASSGDSSPAIPAGYDPMPYSLPDLTPAPAAYTPSYDTPSFSSPEPSYVAPQSYYSPPSYDYGGWGGWGGWDW